MRKFILFFALVLICCGCQITTSSSRTSAREVTKPLSEGLMCEPLELDKIISQCEKVANNKCSGVALTEFDYWFNKDFSEGRGVFTFEAVSGEYHDRVKVELDVGNREIFSISHRQTKSDTPVQITPYSLGSTDFEGELERVVENEVFIDSVGDKDYRISLESMPKKGIRLSADSENGELFSCVLGEVENEE